MDRNKFIQLAFQMGNEFCARFLEVEKNKVEEMNDSELELSLLDVYAQMPEEELEKFEEELSKSNGQ